MMEKTGMTGNASPETKNKPCSTSQDISHLRTYVTAASRNSQSDPSTPDIFASLDAVLEETGMTMEELEGLCKKEHL